MVVCTAMPRVLGINAWIESIIGAVIWFIVNVIHYKWVLYEERLLNEKETLSQQTHDAPTHDQRGMEKTLGHQHYHHQQKNKRGSSN